jgi:hypothetical protein
MSTHVIMATSRDRQSGQGEGEEMADFPRNNP